jgi:D-glycero-D-manno-heptose 1,7-bisphosphate phosphatase
LPGIKCSSQGGAPAVFLDRDGVLNESIVRDGKPSAPTNVTEFEIYPEAQHALNRLKQAGYVLVVVTNQPEVGRGTLAPAVLEAMHRKLKSALPIDRIEVCCDDGVLTDSAYRKPKPGMILRAAAALTIDLGASYVVGDRWRDIDAGVRAGCRTILIDRGWNEALGFSPDFVCANISEAAQHILDCA